MTKQDTLKSKTVTGLLWTLIDIFSNQGIQIIIQIVLARLLTPKDFGLIGMLTVFIAISQTIVDSGFSNALIREKSPSQTDYSTVFYFNFFISIFLYLILYISSAGIASFYKEPQLVNLLRFLSLIVIINSFGLIQRTILTKKLDFKTQTIVNFISSILSGLLAILLAYRGFGVWSLVVRTIIMQLIQSVLFMLLNKWKPSFIFSINSFKRLFGFGSKLLASEILNTLYNNLYYLLIGKFYSPRELGYYTNAQKIRDAASSSITTSVQKVSYPVLSTLQEENSRLIFAYKKIIKNTVYVTFPIMLGLAAIADPLFNLLLGEKWNQAIIYFQILCIAGTLFPLHAINLNVLQVKGRSDLFLRLEVIKKAISLIIIAIALFYGADIIVLLLITILNSVVSFFINTYYSKKLLNYSTLEQIRDLSPALIISIIMATTIFLLSVLLSYSIMIILIIQVLSGIFLYIALSKFFKIKELETIYLIIKSFINK